jgi:PEP-CTERM motif
MKTTRSPFAIFIYGLMVALPLSGKADSFYTVNNTTADAFLATGSPNNPVGSDLTSLNFGGAGTLAIAPASSTKGRFDSIIKFNLAGAVSQFDTTYRAGNWQITGLTLQLASNFGVQGSQPNNNIFNTINTGSFGINWLSYDNWTEGTGGGMGSPANGAVSFTSMSTLFSNAHDSLGTYLYTPPGNNVYLSYTLPLNADLVADASAGGDVSLYFYAADDQVSYLFNARSFAANHPEITLSVAPVPEPSTWSIMAVALVGFMGMIGRKIRI